MDAKLFDDFGRRGNHHSSNSAQVKNIVLFANSDQKPVVGSLVGDDLLPQEKYLCRFFNDNGGIPQTTF